jgi:hypothetical protein
METHMDKGTDKGMDRSTINGLLLVLMMVVVVLAALWATATFLLPFAHWIHRLPPYNIAGDLEFFYVVDAVVSTLNIAILLFLLVSYVSLYRRTRSEFSIGLIIFSVAFLMYVFASNPFVIRAFGFHPFGLGPFAFLPELFTLGALVVLLYLNYKY